MLVAQRRCDNFRTCDNEGRYLCVDGYTLCSLCAMQSGKTAVRISDLPRFIELAKVVSQDIDSPEAEELRRYLPRKP